MSMPSSAWQQPLAPVGPAPGVQFAGHGARLGAYILDAIIVGLVVSVFTVIVAIPLLGDAARVGFDNPDRFNDPATWREFGPSILAFVAGVTVIGILALLYFPYFWARGGQTPGMRVTGIRVVNDRDGSPITWGTAFLRLIGYWVSSAVFSLGFIWILIDSRRRGWHDLIAGTCVIASR